MFLKKRLDELGSGKRVKTKEGPEEKAEGRKGPLTSFWQVLMLVKISWESVHGIPSLPARADSFMMLCPGTRYDKAEHQLHRLPAATCCYCRAGRVMLQAHQAQAQAQAARRWNQGGLRLQTAAQDTVRNYLGVVGTVL